MVKSLLFGLGALVALAGFASAAPTWSDPPLSEIQIMTAGDITAVAVFEEMHIADLTRTDQRTELATGLRWRTDHRSKIATGWISVALMLYAPDNYPAVLLGPD